MTCPIGENTFLYELKAAITEPENGFLLRLAGGQDAGRTTTRVRR